MIRLFLSYAHSDENYRNELAKHLKILQRQGIIEIWHDRCLLPGDEWAIGIDENLRSADIILLLVSVDFINSEYCFALEMKEALTRHESGEAVVIPVILRPCHWTGLPFGKLQAATREGKPVEKYPSYDEAFLEIIQGIEVVAKNILTQRNDSIISHSTISPSLKNSGIFQSEIPRQKLPHSSNLAIPKIFTDHEKDTFIIDAFGYIARFFEGSLNELQVRNPEVKGSFHKVDNRSFEAAIYLNGNQASKCGIWLGNSFGSRGASSIFYSYSGLGQGNSYNESMSLKDNGNMLGLEPIGMWQQRTENTPLTNQGAAEYYWLMFFKPIQQGC